MTVSSTLNKISYEGDGSNTTFNIPFYVLSESDLTFTLVNEETLAETSITDNFTLTAIDDKWPSVTSELLYPVLGDPIPIGYKLIIVREVALKQETAFSQNAAIQPAVVEQSLDKLVMMIQQQAEELTRCIKAGISSGIDPEVLIAQIIAAAASATTQAGIATTGANTATSQAAIAVAAAELFTLATQAEAEAGTNNVHYMSALRTIQAITANIATQAEAEGGTDNTKLMTSLRTLQLLDSRPATSTSLGGVMVGVGLAITPEGLLSHTGYPSWFYERGDGSDGDYVPTASTTLAGGTYNFSSVNIPAGVTITLTGCVIFKCLGAFVCAGIITANGGNGAANNTGRTGGTSGGNIGGIGGAGGVTGTNAIAPENGGIGFCGGIGGAGGRYYDGGTVTTGGGVSYLDNGKAPAGNANFVLSRGHLAICGGGGGGGLADGAGGGGGGGSMYIIAHSATILGYLTANGGNGGAILSWSGSAYPGSGGGGGGDAVIVIANTILNTGTITANGGAPGVGKSTYTTGVAGSNGIVYLKELGAA